MNNNNNNNNNSGNSTTGLWEKRNKNHRGSKWFIKDMNRFVASVDRTVLQGLGFDDFADMYLRFYGSRLSASVKEQIHKINTATQGMKIDNRIANKKCQCPFVGCDKALSYSYMARHYSKCHKGITVPKIDCTVCGKKLSYRAYTKHTQKCTANPMVKQCSFCNCGFAPKNLSRHEKVCGATLASIASIDPYRLLAFDDVNNIYDQIEHKWRHFLKHRFKTIFTFASDRKAEKSKMVLEKDIAKQKQQKQIQSLLHTANIKALTKTKKGVEFAMHLSAEGKLRELQKVYRKRCKELDIREHLSYQSHVLLIGASGKTTVLQYLKEKLKSNVEYMHAQDLNKEEVTRLLSFDQHVLLLDDILSASLVDLKRLLHGRNHIIMTISHAEINTGTPKEKRVISALLTKLQPYKVTHNSTKSKIAKVSVRKLCGSLGANIARFEIPQLTKLEKEQCLLSKFSQSSVGFCIPRARVVSTLESMNYDLRRASCVLLTLAVGNSKVLSRATNKAKTRKERHKQNQLMSESLAFAAEEATRQKLESAAVTDVNGSAKDLFKRTLLAKDLDHVRYLLHAVPVGDHDGKQTRFTQGILSVIDNASTMPKAPKLPPYKKGDRKGYWQRRRAMENMKIPKATKAQELQNLESLQHAADYLEHVGDVTSVAYKAPVDVLVESQTLYTRKIRSLYGQFIYTTNSAYVAKPQAKAPGSVRKEWLIKQRNGKLAVMGKHLFPRKVEVLLDEENEIYADARQVLWKEECGDASVYNVKYINTVDLSDNWSQNVNTKPRDIVRCKNIKAMFKKNVM